MIIDTSALVAVALAEPEHEPLLDALYSESGLVPSPVLVEYRLVMALNGNKPDPDSELLLADLLAHGMKVTPFTPEDAEHAFAAIEPFGRGNGRAGKLNLLDLMVYGMARRTTRPVLCTGKDFAETDIAIHPASRTW